MKTNFVAEVQALANEFGAGSREYAILTRLVTFHVGRANAVTLPALGEMFGVTGHWIQQHIIAPSRKCAAFLGTCRKGVFVIADTADADAMLNFYDDRIRAETANRDKLFSLVV